MTAITAGLVKELRERTGAGMMECKNALVKAQGNLDEAVEDMRKAGLAKAVKKSGRIAAEGLIATAINAQGTEGVLLEGNCETDFVAREENFKTFVRSAAQAVLQHQSDDLSRLAELPLSPSSDNSCEAQRLALVSQLGENVTLRRVAWYQALPGSQLGVYAHGDANGTRIAAMVELKGGNAGLARDLAMQVAAMNPEYVQQANIPSERLDKEREILKEQTLEQLRAEGKLADKLDMIVEGKVKKFAKEITLLGQSFVKDPNIGVEALLKQEKAEVLRFVRFAVGEGIEKKVDNFVEEVMAQARGA